MPLTHAERQRRYIEKKKILNIEEYKKKEVIKNKNYYNKLNNNNEEINKENIEKEFIILKPLKKRINPLNKSVISETTVNSYLKSMKNIYKNYTNNDIDEETERELLNILTNKIYNLNKINKEFGFLKNNIYDIIKNNNKEIRNLYSVITRIKTYSKQVKQIYPYIEKNQNIYNEKRENKIVDENIINKMNKLSFEKEDILKILNENNKLTINERLIFGLMTLFPTRRAIDYRRMIITKTKPIDETKMKLKDRNNYYYDKIFYFNITKNKTIQKYDVPFDLDNLIKTKKYDENNYLLLNDKKNKPFTTTELSIFIMKTFKKIYDISISALEIRRLYSTYLKEKIKNKMITDEEHRKICEMMNHSYEENKKYAY